MSDENHNPTHKAAMDGLVLGMPGVKGSRAFGYPAYKVNGRIFAFVGGDGVAFKLPAARVQALTADRPDIKPFEVTTGVVWREWVMIEHPDADALAQYLDLFEESMLYVAG